MRLRAIRYKCCEQCIKRKIIGHLEEKKMKKFSSKNYDFHFLRDSIAERDIQEIVELQESCYKEICRYLNIQPNIRIQYYLLDKLFAL